MSSGATAREGSLGVHQRSLGHLPQPQRQAGEQQHQQHQQHQAIQQQRQSNQQQQQNASQRSEVGDTYRYLLRHHVHSKLEDIFSNVLSERPEDPLHYIVEHLRANGVKSAGKDCLIETADFNSLNRSRNEKQQPSESAPAQREVTTEERRDNKQLAARDPVAQEVKSEGVVERHTEEGTPIEETEPPRPPSTFIGLVSANDTPAQVDLEAGTFPSSSPNALAIPLAEPHTQTPITSLCSTRTNICMMRPSSALLAPWTSVRSSRNDTPYGTTGFRLGTGGGPETTYSSTCTTVLDRDDSTRSDLSAFSLASVDMQDFLQEFRSAKAECVGVETQLVDLEMLSEILQCVNIPIPEIPLIAELFDDVKRISTMRYGSSVFSTEEETSQDTTTILTTASAVSSRAADADLRDRVYFEAFLARMAFMIQGRYPAEVIRGTFYSILESVVRKECPADGVAQKHEQQQQQQKKKTGDEPRRTSSSSGSATSRLARAAAKSQCRTSGNTFVNNVGNNLATTPHQSLPLTQTYPIVTQTKSAHCAAANDGQPAAELSPLMHGVSLAVCVEEGLWRGLGIPVSKAEVVNALCILGMPVDDNYEFHVNEFVRLVMALTGQSVLHPVGEKASSWLLSSVGRESSLVPLSGSCKEDGV
ncbi:hypothetical protein TcG_07052 [Trypanosoma cruzi]|nr:hypothetical protein TcG_07052 [Trypanosoma cruzi]